MYNIHSHYENIFSYLKTIIDYPVLLYFYPYGSISYENIEMMHCSGKGQSPIIVCFDQEPITKNFENILNQLENQWTKNRCFIILNTESDSQIKNEILSKYRLDKYRLFDSTYFFHIFAAADWYRSYYYNMDIIPPTNRKLNKKYITFNRITGNSRAYRGIFVAKLAEKKLLDNGHVSFSHVCPEHGPYSTSAVELIEKHSVSPSVLDHTIEVLNSIKRPLRIDHVNELFIPNGSQTIDCIPQMMESFLHVVTETCFWEEKKHLTEKIFKPIVTKNPFVLIGCANNLEYLKSYGFKTFDKWWDESYDSIEDPIQRIEAVVDIIETVCSYDYTKLQLLLNEMQDVLDYNFNHFYSKSFLDNAWTELKESLSTAVDQTKKVWAEKI